MKTRKAQAFMTDFMASVAIFGAILTLFMTMWSLGVDSQTSFDREDMLRKQAERTADFMVTTEGYPSNWEEPGVEARIPGFAENDNVLSAEKIKAFGNMSYERRKTLTKTQNFTLEFRDSRTGEILNETMDGEEGEEVGFEAGSSIGSEPVAYIVQSGTSLSNLEMLDNLNESGREWYFYFPSEEDQSQLSALTAEEVYTNDGSGPPMMEKLISDAADKGWNKFRIGSRIEAASTSEISDPDGDGNNEVFYKDGDDILNIYDIQTGETRELSSVTGFGRIGAVTDFAATEGQELIYLDDNDQIAFYSIQEDQVTETTAGAQDIGDTVTVAGETSVFFANGNDRLAYYSSGTGETETSFSAERVGGTGDIDVDGNTEVVFQNGDDNLAFYDISSNSVEETGFQVQDVGWTDSQRVAALSNNNNHFGVWNYTSSSFQSSEVQAEGVTDFTQVKGQTSVLYLDAERNQDLAVWDPQTELRRYLRTGNSEDVRADDGGWQVDIPGYGRSVAYQDGSGYLNYYNLEDGNTVLSRERAQYVGGAADIDGDGAEEITYIDNDNRNLDYYDFQQGTSIVAQEDGSNVRGKEIGVPSDLDGDGFPETPLMTDNDFLGYYDYQDDQLTDFTSLGQIDTLGGTEDIDREGNQEIIYIADDNVQYYDIADDENIDTGQQASYAGGAADVTGNPELEIVYRNAGQQIEYYNPETDTATEETKRIRRVGSVTQLNDDEGYDALATNDNSRLGYFDFSLRLNYNTVISENTDVQSGNIENDETLRSAVEAGMTYLHTRNDISILSDTFGMNTQDPGSDTAEIQQVEPLLNSEQYSVGDEVPFSNVQTGFQDVDLVFANSTGDPAACMACRQDFGDGKVYYLAGLESEDTSNQIGFDNVSESVKSDQVVVESENPFNQGIDPIPEAETVIVVDRQVAVNRSGTIVPAELEYVVWR